jgi:endonuclease-8
MPEGDTIARTARTLNRALAGKTVVRFQSVLPALTRVHEDAPLTGRTIEAVTSAGKHMLMTFSQGLAARGPLVLHTHMRMNGSWHIYRPGERWRRPRGDMRIVVATEDFEAVGFNIPVAEFIRAADLRRHDELRKLGPDLLSDDFDHQEALQRIRTRSTMQIGDVLLNQRVVAGIGNVYKSEILFACGVNPFVAVERLQEEQLATLLEVGRKFLRANAASGSSRITTYMGYRRTTRHNDPRNRLWVYGRARLPCRRCGTPIRVHAQGPDARLTYWCPHCQPGLPAELPKLP